MGCNPTVGVANLFVGHFPKNCMKLKKSDLKVGIPRAPTHTSANGVWLQLWNSISEGCFADKLWRHILNFRKKNWVSLKVFTTFSKFRDKTCFEPVISSGYSNIATKTQLIDRVFKLTPIHASMIYPIPWICLIHGISVPFTENSNDNAREIRIPSFPQITYSNPDIVGSDISDMIKLRLL